MTEHECRIRQRLSSEHQQAVQLMQEQFATELHSRDAEIDMLIRRNEELQQKLGEKETELLLKGMQLASALRHFGENEYAGVEEEACAAGLAATTQHALEAQQDAWRAEVEARLQSQTEQHEREVHTLRRQLATVLRTTITAPVLSIDVTKGSPAMSACSDDTSDTILVSGSPALSTLSAATDASEAFMSASCPPQRGAGRRDEEGRQRQRHVLEDGQTDEEKGPAMGAEGAWGAQSRRQRSTSMPAMPSPMPHIGPF